MHTYQIQYLREHWAVEPQFRDEFTSNFTHYITLHGCEVLISFDIWNKIFKIKN